MNQGQSIIFARQYVEALYKEKTKGGNIHPGSDKIRTHIAVHTVTKKYLVTITHHLDLVQVFEFLTYYELSAVQATLPAPRVILANPYMGHTEAEVLSVDGDRYVVRVCGNGEITTVLEHSFTLK